MGMPSVSVVAGVSATAGQPTGMTALATGVRIMEVPIKTEKLLQALQERS